MPYIIIKCSVNELDSGSTYFGDKTTDFNVIQALGRTWYSNRGFYVVHEPPCWVLNKLEEMGYTAGPPTRHADSLVWMAHRPLYLASKDDTLKKKK